MWYCSDSCSQWLSSQLFCKQHLRSGRPTRFLMDVLHKMPSLSYPVGGPTPFPEEIQIDFAPVSAMNSTEAVLHHHNKHGLVRPTAAAGILFAILFVAVCAALFCFVYGPNPKDKHCTVDNNSSMSSQSHQIEIQERS
eukprot:Gb_12403 [translate_table: standard]